MVLDCHFPTILWPHNPTHILPHRAYFGLWSPPCQGASWPMEGMTVGEQASMMSVVQACVNLPGQNTYLVALGVHWLPNTEVAKYHINWVQFWHTTGIHIVWSSISWELAQAIRLWLWFQHRTELIPLAMALDAAKSDKLDLVLRRLYRLNAPKASFMNSLGIIITFQQ